MGTVNTSILKEHYDLRRIVEQDLGPAPMRSARASLWKCPFHGERQGYSLAVWANGYRCFGKCQTGGDLFDWLQNYRKLSSAKPCRRWGRHLSMCQSLPHTGLRHRLSRRPPSAVRRRAGG